MALFLAERYWSRVTEQEVRSAADRISAAVAFERQNGVPVELLRFTYSAEDSACLWLVAAPDRAAFDDLARRADARPDRVTEVVDLPANPRTAHQKVRGSSREVQE